MMNITFIPNTLQSAGQEIRIALQCRVTALPKREFVRAWCALAYLFPGLHPDAYAEADNAWPPGLARFLAEAWRRFEAGELDEEELYPSDAQWAGICDRMNRLTPEEAARRHELAMAYGDQNA